MKNLIIASIFVLFLSVACSDKKPTPDEVVKAKTFQVVVDNVVVDGESPNPESVAADKARVETALKLNGR